MVEYSRLLFSGTIDDCKDFLWKNTQESFSPPNSGFTENDTIYNYDGYKIYSKGEMEQSEFGREISIISHEELKDNERLFEQIRRANPLLNL